MKTPDMKLAKSNCSAIDLIQFIYDAAGPDKHPVAVSVSSTPEDCGEYSIKWETADGAVDLEEILSELNAASWKDERHVATSPEHLSRSVQLANKWFAEHKR